MRVLVVIASVLVGSLFIVSGLIKANDPLGFSYKLQEYFEVFEQQLMPQQDSLLVQVSEGGNVVASRSLGLIPSYRTLAFVVRNEINEPFMNPRPDDAFVGPEGDTIVPTDTILQSQFKVFMGSYTFCEEVVQTYKGEKGTRTFDVKVMLGEKVLASEQVNITPMAAYMNQHDVPVTEYVEQPSFLVDFMRWQHSIALMLAIFICVIEIVLGIAIIIGAKPKLTLWSLLILIVFFTFLTFYSAYTGSVTDCGCFGDAIKLTPWESFTKDLVLLVFILIIFFGRKTLRATTAREDMILLPISVVLIAAFSFGVIGWGFPVLFAIATYAVIALTKYTVKNEWVMALVATLITYGFSLYCYWHLPIKDFRPYAVGKSISEGIKEAEELGLDPPIYATMYEMTDTVTGESFMINSNDYMNQKLWENKQLTLRSTGEVILIKEGYEPPIHDFNLYDTQGSERTDEVLAMPYAFLLVSYDFEKADADVQPKVNALVQASETNGGPPMIGLTSTASEKTGELRHKYQSAFQYMTADATALKTIVRSNPGLVLLKEGTVIAKWHANDFPDFEEVKGYLNE